MIDPTQLDERIDTWAAAELAADTAALAALSTDDLVLVGPHGFVLDRAAWLDRYADGALLTTGLRFVDRRVRLLGDSGQVVVVLGTHVQTGSYAGRTNDGRYRVTQTWVEATTGPQLAGLQFSPIAQPPAP